MITRIACLALLALGACLTGCVPGNLEGVVKEMAKSDRSWCLAATGYGVNVKIGGAGTKDGTVGNMACSDGGLSLQTQSNQIGVPMTLVPQLSIGQPTLTPARP